MGDFLCIIYELLFLDGFWDEVFCELSILYLLVCWSIDNFDLIVDKNVCVMNLIVVYCNCGYLMVDIDLLWLDKVWFCSYFDFEVLIYGLMLWDFDWVFKVDGFVGV